jgi:hypothetical protein
MALRFGNETIPSPSTTGLIMNIDISNLSSFNNATTTATDLSGNSNNMTVVGSPTYTAPTVSTPGFFSFPGNDISRYIIRNPFSMPTTTVTTAMWVRQLNPRGFPNTGCGILSYEVTGAGNNILIYDGNFGVEGLVPHIIGAAFASGISIMNDLWSHVVFTTNRTTGVSIMYVNSSRQYSFTFSPGTLVTAGGSLIIAQEQDTQGGGLDPLQSFKGDFSSLKIYNRVLSASEVAVLFNSERTLFGV